MSDKCQVYIYKLNSKLSLKRSVWWVGNVPVTPPFLPPPPCFLLNPPCIPCCCFPRFVPCLSVSSSLTFSTSLSLSLDLNSVYSCQFFCWCFLYFHLTLFCRAYRGLLTALAVRYLCSVYLSGDTLSSLQRSQPAGLFGQAVDPLT